MNSNGSSLTPWPMPQQAAAGDRRVNPYARRTASLGPPTVRRLFDAGTSASSSNSGNTVQTVQTQILAVQTQEPDTPEKALLKQRNEQL